jgi:FemAB-related protein (PEP-CTERM system-associated)
MTNRLSEGPIEIALREGRDLCARMTRWGAFVAEQGQRSPSRQPAWVDVLARGLRQVPYCIEAETGGRTVGILPLSYVKSALFGRFLVSLPYLNVGGVLAESPEVAGLLIDRAVELADDLDVRYLELRHETPIEHAALGHALTSKVHMRMMLPGSAEELWDSFKPKVRNQIRKGRQQGFSIHWGGRELLDDFHAVFSRTMRDLGTPVFGRELFDAVLDRFPNAAELCVLRLNDKPIASALLVHGAGITEVPSASTLHSHHATNANMLMYWHLLERAIERKQTTFDFGRSSVDSSTQRFKKQWGALPEPAVWQYYVRKGSVGDMRLESGKYRHAIELWRRLPVWLTRCLGPRIVRGIP